MATFLKYVVVYKKIKNEVFFEIFFQIQGCLPHVLDPSIVPKKHTKKKIVKTEHSQVTTHFKAEGNQKSEKSSHFG